MAFDQAFAGLAAQRTDLQHLQGRAKDLTGFLTLAASFLAAFGKSYVEGLFGELDSRPDWMMWLFVVRDAVAGRTPAVGFSRPSDFYMWYAEELCGFLGKNSPALQRRKYAVWIATASLAGSVILIGYLVLSKV